MLGRSKRTSISLHLEGKINVDISQINHLSLCSSQADSDASLARSGEDVENSVRRRGEEPEHLNANLPTGPSRGDTEGLGNTAEQGLQICGRNSGPLDESGPQSEPKRSSQGDNNRQTESALGRNIDGPACGLGYANMPSSGQDQADSTIVVKSKCLAGIPYDDLVTSCDNRTDELRLLGNGVVPATAERAFNVLIQKLMQ